MFFYTKSSAADAGGLPAGGLGGPGGGAGMVSSWTFVGGSS